jgi:flagellar biosynthesis protein FlhG
MTAVIAIASGKPGVGKSLLSANLAQYLNHKGYRTGLLAAGAREPLWGVSPSAAWPDLLEGRRPLPQLMRGDVFGVDLMLTSGHGHILERLDIRQADGLGQAMDQLDDYAYLIVDLAPMLSTPALACCLTASETLLVLTPERAVLSASFEWLIHLARHGGANPVHVVLNQVRKPALAQSLFIRFRDLAHKRLRLQIDLWGAVGLETALDLDAARRRPLSQAMPQSRLLRDIHAIADRLTAEQPAENQTRPLKTFWQAFVERLEQLPSLPTAPGHPENHTADTKVLLQEPQNRSKVAASALRDETDAAEASPHRLARVHARLAEISEELSAIRRLLESGLSPGADDRNRKGSGPSSEILLDFDAFLDQHLPGGNG